MDAIAAPVDFIEADISATADDFLVCFHPRLMATEDQPWINLRDFSLAELNAFHAERLKRRNTVPTLEDLLRLCQSSAHVGVMIDIKDEARDLRIVETVTSTVRSMHMICRSIVVGSATSLLEQCRRLEPELKTCLLVRSLNDLIFPQIVSLPFIDMIQLDASWLDETGIKTVQSAGKAVCAWSINTRPALDLALNRTFDMVVTDHPRAILRALAERSAHGRKS
jgi:glycerophosphoryl diester phosphodiesterase